MKFAKWVILAWMPAAVSCDRIEIPQGPVIDYSRSLDVSVQHPLGTAYLLDLVLNGDTVVSGDTTGDVSVPMNTMVGDVLVYTLTTGTTFGATLTITEQDSIILLLVDMSSSGVKTATGVVIVQ